MCSLFMFYYSYSQTVMFVFNISSMFILVFIPSINASWKKQCWLHAWPGCSLSTTLSIVSKLLARNMYWWSRKTLDALHFSENGISTKSFSPQKMSSQTLFLVDAFNYNVTIYNVYNWHHSGVIVMKLTAVIQNSNSKSCFSYFLD